jgi:glycopeptide antibiotics resistance protein
MLDGTPVATVGSLLVFMWLVLRLVRDKDLLPRTVAVALFLIYLVEVARVAFFPMPLHELGALHLPPDFSFVNLVPFERLGTLHQAVGNVVMGVPFGLIGRFVLRRPSNSRVLLAGAATFATVEILQIVIGIAIGVPGYRSFDINDVIFNTLGVLLGILMLLAIGWMFLLIDRRIGGSRGPYRRYAYNNLMYRQQAPSRGRNRQDHRHAAD